MQLKKKPAHRAELPLKKDAGQMEMVLARAIEDGLRDLLERYPGHFRALRAIIEGRPDEAGQEYRRDLRKWSLLLPDGSPRPNVKAVMMATLRDTPDGPAIVDPLDATHSDDAKTLRQAEKELEKIARKGWAALRHRLSDHGEDHGQGNGR